MSDKPKIKLNHAQAVADQILLELEPYCDRLVVAGSVRRRKPVVGDIEILCISKHQERDLFGDPVNDDDVTKYLASQLPTARPDGHWEYRFDIRGRSTFGPKNKYLLRDTIPVDVFTTSAAAWGISLMIRTGSAEWNERVMARFKHFGLRGHIDGITYGLKPVPCSTEEDVFRALGWDWVPPELRNLETAKRLSKAS